MIAGNLCRCTGYQNIVKAERRSSRRQAGPAPGHRFETARALNGRSGVEDRDDDTLDGLSMTTKLMGQKVQRVEDQRFLRGQGRYVDDVAVGAGTLHAAVLRSPHAHARIVDIDVADGARRRGRARRVDLRGPAEPQPRWPSRCRC